MIAAAAVPMQVTLGTPAVLALAGARPDPAEAAIGLSDLSWRDGLALGRRFPAVR